MFQRGLLPLQPNSHEVIATDVAALAPPFRHAPITTPALPSQTLLGDACANTPAAVHTNMVEMAMAGQLPISTPEQRLRNRRTKGSCYGVPPGLSQALEHGYISPNMAPPPGLLWRHRGGAWTLCPRGG